MAQNLAPLVQFTEIDVLEKPSCYSYELYSRFSPTLLPYTKFYLFIYIRELLGHKVTQKSTDSSKTDCGLAATCMVHIIK
jgi:hypothetical protein